MEKNVKPYSLKNMINIISDNFAIFFIIGLFFLGGFMSGSIWTQNQMLKNGTSVGTGKGTGTDTAAAADPSAPAAPTLAQLTSVKVTGDDYIRGNEKAKITLVEFSDFECPFCARFHPTLQQVMQEYGDNVRLVYRHYPLPFHPNAQKAAEASECVAEQKSDAGFWAFNDAIFAENDKLGGSISPAAIQTAAQATGVDMTSFNTCLDSGKYAQKIKDQMAEGTAAGITGTPGTIVLTEDGKAELIPGAYTFDQVKPILDKYL